MIIANSNLYHGAATRAEAGFTAGWGIRNYAGPVTIVNSRIQGTRYHNLRVHSQGNSGELLYVSGTTFVAEAEGRTAWMWNNINSGPWDGQGAIIENSAIYSYATADCGLGQEINAANVGYSRVRNNQFYGAGIARFTQGYLNAQARAGGPAHSANGGDHDWTEGNTFSSLVTLPAWRGSGDPTLVPLPGGLRLSGGESPCLSF